MRYFIVFYRLKKQRSESDFLNIESENYPCYNSVLDQIEMFEEPKQRQDIIVTNIIELNGTDYNNWIK